RGQRILAVMGRSGDETDRVGTGVHRDIQILLRSNTAQFCAHRHSTTVAVSGYVVGLRRLCRRGVTTISEASFRSAQPAAVSGIRGVWEEGPEGTPFFRVAA